MAALDSAHAALALGLPTLISPRLSSADPRDRHRGLSHHTRTVLDLLLAPVERRRTGADEPRQRDRGPRARQPADRHRLKEATADLDGLRRLGPASHARWAAR